MGELLLFNIQDPEKKIAIRLTALRLGLRRRIRHSRKEKRLPMN